MKVWNASEEQIREAIDAVGLKVHGEWTGSGRGIDRSWWDESQFGHDFWLTRNRHGAGS